MSGMTTFPDVQAKSGRWRAMADIWLNIVRYDRVDLDAIYGRNGELVGHTRWDAKAFKSMPVQASEEPPCPVCLGVQRDWPSCRLDCCPQWPMLTKADG